MPEDGLKTVGQRLKFWRKRRGIKGYQLAESISVSQGSLSEIENGKSLPSAKTITSLMKLEGMDIFWLLIGEERTSKHLKALTGKQKKVSALIRELENHLLHLIETPESRQ